jgi:hypothetical protein
MNLKLTIEGDASQLAMVLAALGGVNGGSAAGVVTHGNVSVSGLAPNAAPTTSPFPPMPTAVPAGDDDDGPANPNAPATDVNGLPWDERIHAKTKGTTGDGAWRRRRGVDDATVQTVEAELRARAPAPIASAPTAPAMVPPMPQPIPMPPPVPFSPPAAAPMPVTDPGNVATGFPAAGAAPAFSPPPMPQPVPEPVQTNVAQVSGSLDFAQFMQHLSGQMAKRDASGAPLVHADYLASVTSEIAGAFSVTLNSITDIATNPAMITYAVQVMQRDQRW